MATITLDARDLELLGQGQWEAPETDARSRRLARLRLCHAVQGTRRAIPGTNPVRWILTWRTSDLGRHTHQHRARAAQVAGT